ncbi:hypothetical protein F4810DRAFT_575963 [Camillea tinctor]|nr:hypothetical protein F4810DRAFT_575963 [Camillea tinctor]
MFIMNGGISKARTRRPRVNLSKALQETLLAAITDPSAELLQGPRDQRLVDGDISLDAPLQSKKRPLDDVTSDIDPLPAKRARLAQTDTQQPRVEQETAEQETTLQHPTLQHPKPRSPKYPYASFLRDFVEPVPDPHSTFVTSFVSEWLESVGSDREKRCRSDSHLHYGDLLSRQLTRSAPEMGKTKDPDGPTLPATPTTTGLRAYRLSTISRFSDANASKSSSPVGVRDRLYRQHNLALNHIYIQRSRSKLPPSVAEEIENTLHAKRGSPELTAEEMEGIMDRLDDFTADGCDEGEVADFLNDSIFPNPRADRVFGSATGLMSSSHALVSQHLVPSNNVRFKVTQPKPGKLYGYSGDLNVPFTESQIVTQSILDPRIPSYPAATSNGLRFPFFAIEFKAAGGARGDLWVATNQCAGASSACLNAVDRLNTLLREYGSKQSVDNLSYSIAVDNNTAQLFISWKEGDLNCYLQRVGVFLLASPEDFKEFRKQVRNILDWGKDTRLTQIKIALDTILDEDMKKVARDAKACKSS